MSTVAKGTNRKAHRQPGQAAKNIRKSAPSDKPPMAGKGRKGAPGNPVAVSGVDVSDNMDGHGNAGLSGVEDKQ